jgi:hypothetical protein
VQQQAPGKNTCRFVNIFPLVNRIVCFCARLDKSAFSEESQTLLQDVEKKNNNLNILYYPWFEEECNKRGVHLVWHSRN